MCLFKVWIEKSIVDSFGPLPTAKHGMRLIERPRFTSDSAPAGMRAFQAPGSTEQANAPQEDSVWWQELGTVPGFSEFYLNSHSYLRVKLFISQKPDRLK